MFEILHNSLQSILAYLNIQAVLKMKFRFIKMYFTNFVCNSIHSNKVLGILP